MTLSEFKAWFEGFTENIEGGPSEAQFAKIKAKVSEITGTPITYPVYVERYHDYIHRWPYWATAGYGIGTGNISFAQGANVTLQNNIGEQGFNSHAAMYAIGKAEAMN